MGRLRAKTKAKAAELEAKKAAADTKKAAQESAAAVRDLATALLQQVKQLHLDEKAQGAVKRVRSTDAFDKALATADELGRRLRDWEALQSGREVAQRTTTQALSGLGAWLASGRRAERLGIEPADRKRRGWLVGLAGLGLGYVIGALSAPKRVVELRHEIGRRGGAVADDLRARAEAVGEETMDLAAGAPPPLADQVRNRLSEDPRTSDLGELNINVADNTVFVRGSVPMSADHEAIREVIASVEGVEDVDLQINPS